MSETNARLNLFDSHCHVDDRKFDGDRDEVLARMTEYGVTRYAVVGSDMESSKHAIDFAQAHDGAYAVVGIHPHEAKTYQEGDLDTLTAWLKEAGFTAIRVYGDRRMEPPREGEQRIYIKARKGCLK